MQAVILAAGKGLRLKPITDTIPKGLVSVAGKPLLQHTLEALPASITEVIFVIGYKGEQIREHFGGRFQDKPISYVIQNELNGTGSALFAAQDKLSDSFLVVNGDDIYTAPDLESLIKYRLAILAIKTHQEFPNVLEIDADNTLKGIVKRTDHRTPFTINCGAYVLNTNFFTYPLQSIETHSHMEYSLPHTISLMAKNTPVHIVLTTQWLQVGTPGQLQAANEALRTIDFRTSFG